MICEEEMGTVVASTKIAIVYIPYEAPLAGHTFQQRIEIIDINYITHVELNIFDPEYDLAILDQRVEMTVYLSSGSYLEFEGNQITRKSYKLFISVLMKKGFIPELEMFMQLNDTEKTNKQ